jgi:hypothetical protein
MSYIYLKTCAPDPTKSVLVTSYQTTGQSTKSARPRGRYNLVQRSALLILQTQDSES